MTINSDHFLLLMTRCWSLKTTETRLSLVWISWFGTLALAGLSFWKCLRGIFLMMRVLLTGTWAHYLAGGAKGCLSNLAGWSLDTPSSVHFLKVFFSGALSVSKLVVSSFARIADSLCVVGVGGAIRSVSTLDAGAGLPSCRLTKGCPRWNRVKFSTYLMSKMR